MGVSTSDFDDATKHSGSADRKTDISCRAGLPARNLCNAVIIADASIINRCENPHELPKYEAIMHS
jgi:hypothetical protein